MVTQKEWFHQIVFFLLQLCTPVYLWLLAIKGRRRLPQIELAEKYGVKDYPCPAGGCRLTDPIFAKRVKEAFEHNESRLDDLQLLKYGRHFRLPTGAKVVVGRNEKENKVIPKFAREDDLLFEVEGYGSPIVLLRKKRDEEDIEAAVSLCVRYSDAKNSEEVKVKIMSLDTSTKECTINSYFTIKR